MRTLLCLAGGLAFAVIACSDDNEDAVGYEVIVEFTRDYSDADVQAVIEFLHGFDPNGDFQLQESFPPTLRGTMTVDEPDFCQLIERELAGRPQADVRCFGFGRLYSPGQPSRSQLG